MRGLTVMNADTAEPIKTLTKKIPLPFHSGIMSPPELPLGETAILAVFELLF